MILGDGESGGIVHTMTQNLRQLPDISRDVYGSTKFLGIDLGFDANGNVATSVDLAPSGHSRTMSYDDLDRLAGVSNTQHWTGASYSYDPLDNLRTSQLVKGSGTDTLTYSYHASTNRPTTIAKAGVPTWSYSLDARGNVLNDGRRQYTWTRANRLASAKDLAGTVLESYEYDGHGRRVVSWRADGTAGVPVYGLDGKLRQTADNRKGGATTHVYLGDDPIADVFFRWSDGLVTPTYLHTDALGSPVARTNASRTVLGRSVYAPYGQVVDDPANPADNEVEGIGYTGHAYDAVTDLVYMQQRYYDPMSGRFLSVDPVTTNSVNGGNFNRYWYGNNNPFRFTDPDGRLAIPADRSSCHLANACLSGGQSRARASQEKQYAAAQKDPSTRQQIIDRMHAESGASGLSPTYDPNLIEDAGAVDSINGSWTIGPKAFDYKSAADLGSVIFHESVHKVQFRMFPDFHQMAQDNRDNALEYEAHTRTLSGENPFRSRMSGLYRTTSEKEVARHLGAMNPTNRAIVLSGGTCATSYCNGGE